MVVDNRKILITIIIALAVFGLINLLARSLIIYGRRRLLLSVILGFTLKLIMEYWLQPLAIFQLNLQSIGYIIPGLIANEMGRQKIVPTLAGIGIVTIIIYLTLLIL